MPPKIATEIIKNLTDIFGNSPLSRLEVMMMIKIPSDGYEVYSIQKGDVTFLAWVKKDGSVSTRIISW